MTNANLPENNTKHPIELPEQRVVETLSLLALQHVKPTPVNGATSVSIQTTNSSSNSQSFLPRALSYIPGESSLTVMSNLDSVSLLDVFAGSATPGKVFRPLKEKLSHLSMEIPLNALLRLTKDWDELAPFQKALLITASQSALGRKCWAVSFNLSPSQQARVNRHWRDGKSLSQSMPREMKALAKLGPVIACLEFDETENRPHIHALVFGPESFDDVCSAVRKASNVVKVSPKARLNHIKVKYSTFPPGWLLYMFKSFNPSHPMSLSSVYLTTEGRPEAKQFSTLIRKGLSQLTGQNQSSQGKSLNKAFQVHCSMPRNPTPLRRRIPSSTLPPTQAA